MMTRTRPTIRFGSVDHLRTHRIQLYVTHARQHIFIGVNRARFVPAFPERTGPAFQRVVTTCLATSQSLHQPPQARHLFPRHQKRVHVIGHQAVCIHLDAELRFEFRKRLQVMRLVAWLGKNSLPIMAALHNMVRMVR